LLTAAAGTAHSLAQTGGSQLHQQGLFRGLPALQPTHISWWAMTTSASYSGYFVLTSTSVNDYFFYLYFTSNNTIATSLGDVGAYVPNQWYHFEMRNISWTARTFDLYVDDALVRGSGHLYNPSGAVGRLDIYNWDAATAYWDEITFE
jgi:hypothetical protein